jgi:dual specificity tyrosine-phosphorylation-regulated kinase 2/3/4
MYEQLNETNPRRRYLLTASYRLRPEDLNPIVPNPPMSPTEALNYYRLLLTDHEQTEILHFPEIYFVGRYRHKIIPDPTSALNYGFDDDTHNAQLIVGDHLAYRFEIVKLFGAGAFGQVVRCFDHKTRTEVAVKVIVNTAQMHEQGMVEAQIVSVVNNSGSRYIVKAFDFFLFRGHVCITFEILGMNLFELCEANDLHPLPVRTVRIYALQLLKGLEMCHRNGVVHCDIKPENVLLVKGSQSVIKLIDFGSGCFVGHQKYEYIQSRFYRAPEVMLGLPYGPPMDVWSTALVIAELLIGKPLWPGDDELEQLWMITTLLGNPPLELVAMGKRRDEFFDDDFNLRPIQKSITPLSLDLSEALNTEDRQLIDFLKKCLTWDAAERLTAGMALRHPWIRSKELFVSDSLKTSSLLPELISGRGLVL